jgi:hypothetical protein
MQYGTLDASILSNVQRMVSSRRFSIGKSPGLLQEMAKLTLRSEMEGRRAA